MSFDLLVAQCDGLRLEHVQSLNEQGGPIKLAAGTRDLTVEPRFELLNPTVRVHELPLKLGRTHPGPTAQEAGGEPPHQPLLHVVLPPLQRGGGACPAIRTPPTDRGGRPVLSWRRCPLHDDWVTGRRRGLQGTR